MMNPPPLPSDLARAADRIRAVQRDDGGIPWYEDGVLDAWNHAEAIMGLNIAGAFDEAQHGFNYLIKNQLPDGSWRGQLGSAVPIDDDLQNFSRTQMATEHYIRDTNSSAYIATAVWHDYCCRGDIDFTRKMWRMVRRAIDFVLVHQSEYGDIHWAAADDGVPHNDALLTGCSSIYKSLGCACALARLVGAPHDDIEHARQHLRTALVEHPERFDRNWESKKRFSMDWYYPVLSGALGGTAARAHLEAKWDVFVVEGYGCLCVADAPWVTIAESAELILALLVAGLKSQAYEHFSWLEQFRAECGAYWMGYQTQEKQLWPIEKPPWTAAAVLLAADALYDITPAAVVFRDA